MKKYISQTYQTKIHFGKTFWFSSKVCWKKPKIYSKICISIQSKHRRENPRKFANLTVASSKDTEEKLHEKREEDIGLLTLKLTKLKEMKKVLEAVAKSKEMKLRSTKELWKWSHDTLCELTTPYQGESLTIGNKSKKQMKFV